MAGESIPELNYSKPDGTLFTRREMEEQMRQVWPKIYWVRLKAIKAYGLHRQAAFDMKEAFLRHWTLDEMIRRGQVLGDVSGVDPYTYNDEASTRQFIQRLQFLIQANQAITPQEGEGVDMTHFVPPPPPMTGSPNGAPAQQMPFQPPPAQQGYAPPMPAGMPPTVPQQGQAPQMQPPMPMGQPGMMPPGAPQFAPPMPGGGMPTMPSTPVPPMPGTPPPAMPAPQQAAPQGGGGRRGKRGGDQATATPPAPQTGPVPPMPQGPPQGFAPPGQFGPPGAPPMPPQGYAPPPPGAAPAPQFAPPVQQQAPSPQAVPAAQDPATQQKLDQILSNQQQIISGQQQVLAGQDRLAKEWNVLQIGLATWLRATYQRPGAADLRSILTELGIPLPQ